MIRVHRLPHRLWSCCRIFLHSAPACDFMHSATRGSVFHGSGPSSPLQLPCRRFRPASSIAASVAAKRHSAGFKTRATAFAASFNVASFNAASFIQCRRPSLCHHRAPFTPPCTDPTETSSLCFAGLLCTLRYDCHGHVMCMCCTIVMTYLICMYMCSVLRVCWFPCSTNLAIFGNGFNFTSQLGEGIGGTSREPLIEQCAHMQGSPALGPLALLCI